MNLKLKDRRRKLRYLILGNQHTAQKMKTTSKILITLAIGLFLFSCDKSDDKEPEIKGGFKIEGTIVTNKTIHADNTIQALMEDFDDEEETDIENSVGSDKVKDKAFSITVQIPDNFLKSVSLEKLRKEAGKNLIRLESKNTEIKAGFVYILKLLKSGTTIVNFDSVMLCTNEGVTGTNTKGDTEWIIPHGIMYFYSDADFVYYKSKGAFQETAGYTPSIYKLDVKKGWNLIKIDTEFTDGQGIECTTLETINKIPQGYEWRLISDLFPNMMNGGE